MPVTTMTAPTAKITVRGKTYDPTDAADLKSLQTTLVPDNWPTARADGVRMFLNLQNMLSFQLKRHLAANFKRIAKQCLEEGEDGGRAQIKVAFAFKLDMSAPTVAAIAEHDMSYGVRFSTKGKPQTYDSAQGELFNDDLSSALDVRAFEKENEESAKAQTEDRERGAPAASPDPTAGGDVTAENTPGDQPATTGKGRKRR